MTIKRWLAGAAMLALAALPAASGVVANDLGPDNAQRKQVSSATSADDAAMQQDGSPGVASQTPFTAVLADVGPVLGPPPSTDPTDPN